MRTAARAQEAMEIVPCESRQRQPVEASKQQQKAAAVDSSSRTQRSGWLGCAKVGSKGAATVAAKVMHT